MKKAFDLNHVKALLKRRIENTGVADFEILKHCELGRAVLVKFSHEIEFVDYGVFRYTDLGRLSLLSESAFDDYAEKIYRRATDFSHLANTTNTNQTPTQY